MRFAGFEGVVRFELELVAGLAADGDLEDTGVKKEEISVCCFRVDAVGV